MAECMFLNSLKNKEGTLSGFVDDRKLRGISTKVSDRIGTQSYLDRHLVQTNEMSLNRLKKSFEGEQNLTSQFCGNALIFENLIQNVILFVSEKLIILIDKIERRVNGRKIKLVS